MLIYFLDYYKRGIGTLVNGRYQLIDIIGHGGCGYVFSAIDTKTGMVSCIFVLSLNNLFC
jgi:hypothetical protein